MITKAIKQHPLRTIVALLFWAMYKLQLLSISIFAFYFAYTGVEAFTYGELIEFFLTGLFSAWVSRFTAILLFRRLQRAMNMIPQTKINKG